MAVKEAELKRLKAELEAIDSDRARSEEERKKMRATFEEKVEQARKQLMQLQKQLREGEAAKVHREFKIQNCSQSSPAAFAVGIAIVGTNATLTAT